MSYLLSSILGAACLSVGYRGYGYGWSCAHSFSRCPLPPKARLKLTFQWQQYTNNKLKQFHKLILANSLRILTRCCCLWSNLRWRSVT